MLIAGLFDRQYGDGHRNSAKALRILQIFVSADDHTRHCHLYNYLGQQCGEWNEIFQSRELISVKKSTQLSTYMDCAMQQRSPVKKLTENNFAEKYG